jgi:protein-S-isoprenylcysteine O-methyltransferase Ste14/CBS domain-containing protein
MTIAREIMRPGAECICEHETLEFAARRMRDLDVGELLICGDDDKLNGILTDRDIVIKCLATGGNPATVSVGELAQGKPVTVAADADVSQVLRAMEDHVIRRVPVIESHRPVGMISAADVARSLGSTGMTATEEDPGGTRPEGTVGRRRIDVGRLLVVPAAAVMAVINLITLTRGFYGGIGALQWAYTALVGAFYTLIIWCYLRRRPAVATSGSITAHVAAVTATLAPFVFPLLPATAAGPTRQVAALVLLMGGTAWTMWSMWALGRSVSVLAQAREVVERGPYRWLRHPFYVGELVSGLGLIIYVGTPVAAAVWLLAVGLQVYRALREEQVLLRALPDYDSYRRRTAALLPGIF